MKKVLILLLIFVVFPICYAAWPVYQGLAHRDKVPMLGFDFDTWPVEQPSSSHVLNADYSQAGHLAIAQLIEQQSEVMAPGYTAAVAINGELVWAGSVGWADIGRRVPMTIDTQLRIGSTSKALTATGLARLVEQQKLDLDAPLSSYFHPLPNPEWANITARQLASHSAGIPHYRENTERFGVLETLAAQTHYADVMDAVSLFDESELLFEPGERFSYSSLGTVLLSAVMQQAAEQPYQQIMYREVFEPLNMRATTMEHPDNPIDNLASFYWRDESEPTRLKPWYSVDLSHRLAGGGWVSTSKDLVVLGQALLNEQFISSETVDEFWTPQRLSKGEVNPQQYGIGWRIHDLELGNDFTPMKYMHHGGVSSGAQSFLMVIPKYRMSIAVNANVRTKVFWDFGKVSHELAKIFIRESLE